MINLQREYFWFSFLAGFNLFAFILSPISFSKSLFDELPPCTLATPAGTLCRANLSTLGPLQKPIGMITVRKISKKIKKLTALQNEEHAIEHPLPIVIGLNRFRILDHHHLGGGIEYDEVTEKILNLPEETVVMIEHNWNHLTKKAFVQKLHENHYFYDRDENDEPITFDQLPETLSEMKDDPYRSLSGDLQKMGGYDKKPSDYFIEFKWAHFLRNLKGEQAIQKQDIEDHYEKTLKKAFVISQSPAAKGLPGYNACAQDLHAR